MKRAAYVAALALALTSCRGILGIGDPTFTDGGATGSGDSSMPRAPCVIEGMMYGAGTADPSNPCQTCQPQVSASTWTDADGAAGCSSGKVCSGGSCVAGCFIDGKVVAAGALNPEGACGSCAPQTTTSAWTDVSDGTACTGGLCHAGACDQGCEISGAFYFAGMPDPQNHCQTCQPDVTTSSFRGVSDGTSCATAMVCHGGQCSSGCEISGTYYAGGSAEPNSPCFVCQPSTRTNDWSMLASGAGCGNGQICNANGTCGIPCTIDGSQVPSGTVNPMNPCQGCLPGMSTSVWSELSEGTSCGQGEVCQSDNCVAGCFVDGMVYNQGQHPAGNQCEICTPANSTTSWSDVPGTCGPQMACSGGSCVPGCYIGSTFYPPGGTASGNACQVCDPTMTNGDFQTLADGTSCGAGEVCTGGMCESGCYIGTAFYAAGAAESGNLCETCQPSKSTTAFSPASGASCGTAMSCTSGVCCPVGESGCGTMCCPAGGTCVNPSMSTCCNPGSEPCGTSCCTSGSLCGNAATNLCCQSGSSACGSVCCASGTFCTNGATSTCS